MGLVVAFHAGLLPGGFIGVDVFLVISGFVIMGMLLRELDRTGTIRFRDFYSRRARRLLPALALLTTVVVVLSLFLGSPFQTQAITAKMGLGATYYSANIVVLAEHTGYFAPAAGLDPLLHTWTLSVEEQVYLVFPALLLGGWAIGRALRGGSKRGAALMLAFVGGASFLLCVLTSYALLPLPLMGTGQLFAFYSSVSRIWEFALGAALALAAPHLMRIPGRAAATMGIGGALAIVVGAFVITPLTPYPGLAVLLPALGAAAIITSGFRPSGVSSALATKPFVGVGDLSYGWYLWHWPLIVFGVILWPGRPEVLIVLAVLSIVPAWLSTTYLENPLRRNTAIKGWRAVRLAAICAVIPTLACLGLWAGAQASWGSDAVASMQEQIEAEPAAYLNDCNGSCERNVSGGGPPIYLIGDSTAAQYGAALEGAALETDSPVTFRTTTNCYLLEAAVSVDGQQTPNCSDYVADTTDWLVDQESGVVVVASTWDSFLRDPHVITEEAGVAATTSSQKAEILSTGLTSVIGRLREAGHRVVLVLPTPHFIGDPEEFESKAAWYETRWEPSHCPNIVALRSTADCGVTLPESEVVEEEADAVRIVTAVADATGSTTLDLDGRYCDDGVCRTNEGNRWMFKDGMHITQAESRALAPTFAGVFEQLTV